MQRQDGNAALARKAKALLSGREVGSAMIRSSGRIGDAMAVVDSEAKLNSWFVPIIVHDRLAGFFQFRPDLTMMRYASFQRRAESLEGCPATALWLDETAIRKRFRERAQPGENVGQPFLSYDRSPSRLAWAALFSAADGTTRTLYAAGQAIWEQEHAGTGSTGGQSD
jgi:hypothetical protein